MFLRRKKMKNYLTILVIAFAGLFLNGCAGCGRGYSDGERIGVITKFSSKGFVIKSWEGELNLGGTVVSGDGNGVVPSTWKFTVVDTKLVPKVTEAMESGKKVKCKYTQWAVNPVSMDSAYELLDVEVLK
jgi:hypothetical protein